MRPRCTRQGKNVSPAHHLAIGRASIARSSRNSEMGTNWTYESAGIGSINAKEGDRRLRRLAARCSGRGIAPGCGKAGGNGGAGSTGPQSGTESASCGHGGQRGDGLRDGGASGGAKGWRVKLRDSRMLEAWREVVARASHLSSSDPWVRPSTSDNEVLPLLYHSPQCYVSIMTMILL